MLQPDRRERPRVVSHRAADTIGRIARDMTGLWWLPRRASSWRARWPSGGRRHL